MYGHREEAYSAKRSVMLKQNQQMFAFTPRWKKFLNQQDGSEFFGVL
jgi:hypothetical protein